MNDLKILEEFIYNSGWSVSVAESCTGGLLGAKLTSIPGISSIFKGGIIAYSNEIKEKILSVKEETLRVNGAVSSQTAKEMAYGVRRLFNTTIGISITGIAGPSGGTPEKPVGTVWLGISSENQLEAKLYNFYGIREQIREKSVEAAIKMLIENIKINET